MYMYKHTHTGVLSTQSAPPSSGLPDTQLTSAPNRRSIIVEDDMIASQNNNRASGGGGGGGGCCGGGGN